ncbi:copper chaperone PCu(A)C [Streptomyces piniterrae]|uniref:Copper chaperone PCu(A)C n=1 Tax=Streptomyces piniterrae TaxID=2571125 RepID=A0A4U0N9A5_9ACTN|nr:copper chaperone PCu(A)C [Streptomyces piniterrae]TJZ50266.1 copper chaperone PCu(A)C [Streptomyces piniterrae]
MNRRTTLAAALALTAGLGLAGCADEETAPQLKVDGAYMPQPVTKDMAGAFFTIKNSGAADKLTAVTTNQAKDVTIHKTVGNKMEQVDSLAIPAGGELRLDRGGNHLMLMGLKYKPLKGDGISVQLHFAHAQPINVAIPVRAADYAPKK